MPYFHHFLAESSTMNNKCCNLAQQGNNNAGVIKTVKTGYLLHFKKRLFGKAWREEFVVLYEDSSLIWFRDRDRNEPEGGILLKDAPEMLAAGQWTSRVPAHPEFPNGCTFHQSIAIGSRHRKDKVHWFLCKSDSELIDWMSAISHTLPPIPPPPEELRASRGNVSRVASSSSSSKVEHSLTPPPKQPVPSPASLPSAVVDKRLATFKHQPSSPDILLGKMGRINLDSPSSAGNPHPHYLTEKSRSQSTGKMHHLQAEAAKPRVTFREDVMAGVMMAGALTQWNAHAGAVDGFFAADFGASGAMGAPSMPWDWGMGWGWAGWTPEGAMSSVGASAFCGSCALEQHQAALASHTAHSLDTSTSYSNMPYNGRHEFYFDDDHELGELGDTTTDIGCDFGGDFGGF